MAGRTQNEGREHNNKKVIEDGKKRGRERVDVDTLCQGCLIEGRKAITTKREGERKTKRGRI